MIIKRWLICQKDKKDVILFSFYVDIMQKNMGRLLMDISFEFNTLLPFHCFSLNSTQTSLENKVSADADAFTDQKKLEFLV